MAGSLCVGDLILSINTREVLNAAHDSVILALDVCGDDLTLELQRESQHLRPQGRALTRKFSRSAPNGGGADAQSTEVDNHPPRNLSTTVPTGGPASTAASSVVQRLMSENSNNNAESHLLEQRRVTATKADSASQASGNPYIYTPRSVLEVVCSRTLVGGGLHWPHLAEAIYIYTQSRPIASSSRREYYGLVSECYVCAHLQSFVLIHARC